MPGSYITQIDMNMIVFAVIGNPPALHGLGNLADGFAVDAVDAEIDRPAMHVQTFLGDIAVA